MKRGKIPVLTTTKYRPDFIGIECRSRTRSRHTLQNSTFVNRYLKSRILPVSCINMIINMNTKLQNRLDFILFIFIIKNITGFYVKKNHPCIR
jgi:hypothetical protein